MRKKATTIYDIATKLGLSPSTVSRALKSDPKISPKTRERINKTADELNYLPNTVAAGLRGGRTKTIGVIVPRIDRQFFANAISGIERVSRERKYRVVITQSKEQLDLEREGVEALLQSRVDGLIASLSVQTDEFAHFERLRKRGIPIVFFDRVTDQVDAHRVVIDDRAISQKAVGHLIEQGARRIAHLGGPESVNIYEGRYLGYADALEAAGIPLDDSLVFRNHLREADGAAACETLATAGYLPDAIFAASDFSALGVLGYCQQHNIDVPGDLALVGFANENFTRYLTPALTTVDQQSEELGATAANLLLDQLENKVEAQEMQEVHLTGELIVRGSSVGG